jgi:A/G-specific adenine glycosylase
VVGDSFFVSWFKKNGRQFPWRYEGISPFKCMVTEMLLRQTRAEGVAKLWSNFFNRYVNALSLAQADKGRLTKEITILGFGNQRAEALKHASNYLVQHYDGEVPDSLEELLDIPHIGNYAARAILCFAFNRPVEIVDVNILRFFARYYGIKVKPDIRRNPGVWDFAREALPRGRKRAQQHNYGLLDFTAEICKSGRPRCEVCPLSDSCALGLSQLTSPQLPKG